MSQSSQPIGVDEVDVAVIGGGVAGLTAAYRILTHHPKARVAVLEQADRVGGKLRTDTIAGTQVDVGAESILALRPEAIELLHELGADDDLTTPATTAAAVWSRGAMHPLPRGTVMGVPTDPDVVGEVLTDSEKRRLRNPQGWPDGVVTQDISVGAYVEATYGRAVVDRLVEPLLGGVYAGNADQLSLQATTPALWAAAQQGTFVQPPLQVSTASGAVAPARPPFIGLKGGVGRLPELLAAACEKAGASIATDTTVRALTFAEGVWRLVTGPTTQEREIRAQAVIIAVPPPAAAKLLAPLAPDAAQELKQIEMASSALVTFAFARQAMPALVGSGFLVPPIEGRDIKASTFSSNKWGWVNDARDDVVFVRASFGRAGDVATLQRSDDDLITLAHRELSDALGSNLPQPMDAHVQRWGGGLPQYAVGHRDRVDRIRADIDRLAASAAGIAVAGAAYDGVGIPAVIASAGRAAGEITAYLLTHSSFTHGTSAPRHHDPTRPKELR